MLAEVEALPHSKSSAVRNTVRRWNKIISSKTPAPSVESSRVKKAMLAMRGIAIKNFVPQENGEANGGK